MLLLLYFLYFLQNSEGKWVWSDGSKWGFTMWDDSEPSGGGEDYLELNKSSGRWNDVPKSPQANHGYLCQYNPQGRKYNERAAFHQHSNGRSLKLRRILKRDL